MTAPKLLGISGSLRKDATNTKLLRAAAGLFGENDFTLGDLNLPLYDSDEEAASGVPAGPSGVLKNALDWVSRTEGNPWNGKPVAVMSAAAGRAGGERAQMILRGFMVPFRPLILQGPEIHLANSSNEFDDAGNLTGEIYVRELTALMQALRAAI